MKGFVADLERMTDENHDFRRVLYTGHHLQLVLMSIPPGGETGEEVHAGHDQFFRVEKGAGEIWIDGHRHQLHENIGIVVPSGARHNLINLGRTPLQLYTIYGGPEHRDRIVHATLGDALKSKEHFDGRITEPA